MTGVRRETVALIAPYAVWMACLVLLPRTFAAYAVRTALATAVLAWSLLALRRISRSALPVWRSLAWGIPAGLIVLAIWILPEDFAWYRRWCVIGDPGADAAAPASAALLAVRLFGSAFVIAVAEELFFRRWLLRFAGFVWMVALFAVEHDRFAVAAVAGAVYGLLALRCGLFAAIVAHVTTNLGLGIYVLQTGSWHFW